MKCYRGIVVAVAAGVFLWGGGVSTPSAYAQQAGKKVAVPTSAQLELNDAGVQAIIAEDYDRAVHLFDASLALGPINITYVNRGRALQRAGNCEAAEESFEAAFLAPAMSEPSAENVAATIARYRAELRDTCPGKIVLMCDPLALRISIDGRNMGECPSEPIELSKGEHHIRGTLMGKSVETVVDVAPLKTRVLALKLDTHASAAEQQAGSDFDAPSSSRGVQPLALEDSSASTGSSGSNAAGYWLLGTGTAMIAGGLFLDYSQDSSSNDSPYGSPSVIPYTLYISGGILILYGISALMN